MKKNIISKKNTINLKKTKNIFQNPISKFGSFFSLNSQKTKQSFLENINSQFEEILNNPQSYITRIETFKNLVYLDCFVDHSNNTFYELMDNIQDAIMKKKQIIFQDFCITWWNPKNGAFTNYPVLITDKNLLSKNLAIFDPFNIAKENFVKIFTSLNRLINFEMQKQNLNLLITSKIMISYSKDNGYFLLFAKDVT